MAEAWAYVAIAVIAFAGGLAIGGLSRSSKIETVTVTAPATEGEAVQESPSQNAGAQIFAGAKCGSCHALEAAGTDGEVGPNLDEFLAPDDTTEAVEGMIVDPNAELAEGYPGTVMPQDYGRTMSSEEIHQLAEYLVATTPAKPNP